MKDAALKLALEALKKSTDNFPANVQHSNAITAIEAALAQPAQEPITILTSAGYIADEDDDIQVYQRPWVDLTDEEIESAYWDYMEIATQNGFEKTVKAIEAKLKEKNT